MRIESKRGKAKSVSERIAKIAHVRVPLRDRWLGIFRIDPLDDVAANRVAARFAGIDAGPCSAKRCAADGVCERDARCIIEEGLDAGPSAFGDICSDGLGKLFCPHRASVRHAFAEQGAKGRRDVHRRRAEAVEVRE